MSKDNTNAIDLDFDGIESAFTGTLELPAEGVTEEKSEDTPAEEAKPAETEKKPPVEEKPESKEATPEANAEEEKAAAEPEATTEGKEKEKSWVDRRLHSLASKRREAEQSLRHTRQDLEEERARRERLEGELEQLRSGKPAEESGSREATARPGSLPAPAAGAKFDKPKPILKDYTQEGGKLYKEGEDYDDAAQRHAEELANWSDERRDFTSTQKEQERAVQEQTRGFQADVKAAMEERPDWEDQRDYVLEHASERLQVAISQLPRFSKNTASWPAVVAYLADNPDELETLDAQYRENPYAAIAELGSIRHSLKAAKPAAEPKTTAAPPPVPKKAPAPPVAIGSGATPAPIDLETADMETFAREVTKLGLGKT